MLNVLENCEAVIEIGVCKYLGATYRWPIVLVLQLLK